MNLDNAYLATAPTKQRALEHAEGKIRTWSGRYIDPFEPDPGELRMVDIAHSLSLTCRYSGHVDVHYSVGQHCLEVVRYLEKICTMETTYLAGLLHDAAEAYLGDMASPLKHNPRMATFRAAEAHLQEIIFKRYLPQLVYNLMGLVGVADDVVYHMERISFLFPRHIAEDQMYEKYTREIITPKEPKVVEAEFLAKWRQLSESVFGAHAIDRIPL
jgi:HD domain